MAEGKTIEYRVDNGVAVVEINRPPANAYTTELLKELDAAILDARFDENVHAIVITGKLERFFSAGADIKMLAGLDCGGRPWKEGVPAILKFGCLSPGTPPPARGGARARRRPFPWISSA